MSYLNQPALIPTCFAKSKLLSIKLRERERETNMPYGSNHCLRRYLTPSIIPQTLPKKVLGSIGMVMRCYADNIRRICPFLCRGSRITSRRPRHRPGRWGCRGGPTFWYHCGRWMPHQYLHLEFLESLASEHVFSESSVHLMGIQQLYTPTRSGPEAVIVLLMGGS